MDQNQIEQEKKNSTPMLLQYLQIKEQYQSELLFYRLGDFYELFYDDAEKASKELGLVLTQRQGVPMCGIPWHSHEIYLTRLIQSGYKVAICEQTESPEEAKQKRGYKATIERKVVRVVTPGTLVESNLIKDNLHNFLATISSEKDGKISVGYADISTGIFRIEEIESNNILSFLYKVGPVEIICLESALDNQNILHSLDPFKAVVHTLSSSIFKFKSFKTHLIDFYGQKHCDNIGKFTANTMEASAVLVYYVLNAYVDDNINLPFPKLLNETDYVQMDSFTVRSLELVSSQFGKKKNTLLGTINKTVTSFGVRLLNQWVISPLIDVKKINKRLDFIELLTNKHNLRESIRERLEGFPDIERALARLIMDKAGPKDLNIIKFGLKKAMLLWEVVKDDGLLSTVKFIFNGIDSLLKTLENAIEDDVPTLVRDGNFIKRGFNVPLDEMRDVIMSGESVISSLQQRYVSETNISNLKIKKNNILGFFIEITPNNVRKIPYSFIHKQTLVSAVRYTTNELLNTANKIYSAEANVLQTEVILFEEIAQKIKTMQEHIKGLAEKIAFIDVVSSLASLAVEEKYVRPILTEKKEIDIKGGFHPVVKMNLRAKGEGFTDNDYLCNENSIVSILTGPNMGGKSTFLRQNAIIIILAQIGSFVPASYAQIGIVDKIFSRVGAFDDISQGMSTFMVEMIETASILSNATEKSFIILDEIGRGTSTYDGLAIAVSVAEEIHNNIKARTIFATHYHELIDLKEKLENAEFLTVRVQEEDNKIVFLHKIGKGYADKSYGIHVALLAGVPKHVVERAITFLDGMNKKSATS